MWWTPVRLAVQTLGANPLRTALSTLGIVMGAASLSAVLSLGDGAEACARLGPRAGGGLSVRGLIRWRNNGQSVPENHGV